jgi:adenylate kinase family enzyme
MQSLSSVARINIVGTSGSGKSTFARQLSATLGSPLIEMDKMFWGPNWASPKDEEFFRKLETALSADTWVLDGNYNRTIPIKWKNVQVVIWLDYSFGRTLFQAVQRAFRRSLSQEELWEGTGNRESFKKSFFSKDSILLWTLKTYGPMRKRYAALMQAEEHRHITFIRCQSSRAASRLLGSARLPNQPLNHARNF